MGWPIIKKSQLIDLQLASHHQWPSQHVRIATTTISIPAAEIITCLVRTSTGFCLFCFPGWGLFVGDTRSERGLYQLIGQGLCGQMVAWSNGWIERQVPATGGGTAMTAPLRCRRGNCGSGGGGVDVRRCRRCSIAIAIRGRTLTPALLGRRRWWFAVSERQLLSILDRPAGKERCHGDDRAAADGPNLQIRLARVVDVPLD